MKKLSIILVIIICIGAIISGKVYYHHKIQETAAQAKSETAEPVAAASEKKTESSSGETKKTSRSLSALTANLPKKLQKQIREAKDKNQTVSIDLIGETDIQGLAPLFQNQLDTAYGHGLFQVKTVLLEKKNSLDLYHTGIKKVIGDDHPNVIIYTPPIMNDDHEVSTDDTLAVIKLLGRDISENYPDASYMVQPPNKTSDQTAINDRIDQIKDYMDGTDIPYLNYLKNWPSSGSLAEAVKSDGHTPNEKGLKIWSDYLGNYFSGE
jgi:hypothetical protein